MGKSFFLAMVAVAIAACSHAPVDQGQDRYLLSVNYRGTQVFGPTKTRMEDREIPLGGTCPEGVFPRGDKPPAVLNLMLGQPEDGYFYYSCKTSCWFGVGEGATGKISPGESVVLNCDDDDLKVTLSDMP